MSKRGRQRAEAPYRRLLRSIITASVVTIAVLLILPILGINVAPLMASAGVLGVALGFGAQSLVKDYLSGIFLVFEDQYGVGDLVDLGEAVGVVEDVTLRITRLRDLDGGGLVRAQRRDPASGQPVPGLGTGQRGHPRRLRREPRQSARMRVQAVPRTCTVTHSTTTCCWASPPSPESRPGQRRGGVRQGDRQGRTGEAGSG